MKYTYKCPACDAPISVDAASDEEAVDKLMAAGATHGKEKKHDMSMSENQMKEDVKAKMTKEEGGDHDHEKHDDHDHSGHDH